MTAGSTTTIDGATFSERVEREFGGTGYTLSQLEKMAYAQADAILAKAAYSKRQDAQTLARQAAEAESLLTERMRARGATVADCGPLEAKLESANSYSYELETLANLQKWIDLDEYEAAVQRIVTHKVNKHALNKLEKRGGEIAETIRAATTTTQGAPRLVLREKAQP